MPTQPVEPSRLQKLVGGIAGFVLVIAVLEMTPGWGLLGLNLRPVVYYIITATVGAATGWITRPGYRLPGLIAGAVAGPGAILAMHLLIRNAERVPIALVLVATFIGMIPAIGIFKGLAALQDTTKRS
jgi:hypothetical protein